MRRLFTILLVLATAVPLFAKDPIVTHTEKVDRAGTRSESHHGYLFVLGQPLPDCFWTVVSEGKRYSFAQREYLWGDDGYFPLNDPLTIESTKDKTTAQELKGGYVLGKKRKAGIPDDWLYVEWMDGAAFVAPTAVADLVKSQKLPTLARMLNEDFMKD